MALAGLLLAGPTLAQDEGSRGAFGALVLDPATLPRPDPKPEAPTATTTDDAADDALDGAAREIERGRASWYGPGFHGRRTANGERFDMDALTAAHKTLPFGTHLRVRSLQTGREVNVRINDRGPFKPGMVIDLSRAAAQALGPSGLGLKGVALMVITAVPAPDTKAQDEPAQAPLRR